MGAEDGRNCFVIAAIGAVSRNGMIGLDGWLPWDIPEELAYFEATVAGAALVIGRKTYESMPVVPADSFVVSGRQDYPVRPGCVRVPSVEAGLLQALRTGKPVFAIGGASVYAAAWPYCRRFFLTRIEADFVGDACLPAAIPFATWPVAEERCHAYVERRSGLEVVCRFMQYVNTAPLAVPATDCKLPVA